MLHFLWYLLIGLAAGWIAEKITKSDMTLVMNLVYGVAGAIVGGGIMKWVLGTGPSTLWGSLIVAVLGAMLVIWVVNAVKSKV